MQLTQTIEDGYCQSALLANLAAQFAKVGQKSKSESLFTQSIQLVKIADENYQKPETLITIISTLAQFEKFDQALKFSQTLYDPSKKQEALASISIGMATAGKHEEALKLAQTLNTEPEKSVALGGIAAELVAAKQFDRALEIAALMDHEKANELMISIIAVGFVRAGQIEEAVNLVQKVKDVKEGIAAVAITLAEVGQTERAVQLVQGFDDQAVVVYSLQEIAKKLIEMKQFTQAETILLQGLEILKKIPSPPVNPDSFLPGNNLTWLFFRTAFLLTDMGKYDQAFEVYKIIDDTVKDGSERYFSVRAITEIFVKAGYYDQAYEIIKMFRYDPYNLADLAQQLAEVGQYDDALRVAQEIKSAEYQDYKAASLSKIAAYLALNQQQNKANQFFEEALEIAQTLSEEKDRMGELTENHSFSYKDFALSEIAANFAEANQYDQAFKVAQTLQDISITLRYTNFAIKFTEAGKFEQVVQLLQKINSPEDREYSIKNLTRKFLEAGKFEQAIKMAQMITSEKEQVKAFQTIALKLAEAGQFEQAANIAQMIPYHQYQAQTLAEIAQSCLKAKQTDLGTQYLEQALVLVEQ